MRSLTNALKTGPAGNVFRLYNIVFARRLPFLRIKFSFVFFHNSKTSESTFKSRVGFGLGFFRDPETRPRGFGIGIFNFGLDRKIQKIPKSRGSGSGFENPENLKIPRIGTGILKPLKNPEKSRKSRNPGDRDWDLKIP